MPYCHLFYHFVWATKKREKLITSKVEPVLYGFLQTKAISLGGTIFAINGDKDHTHVVASVPPRLAISEFVGQVKGATSAQFNSKYNQGEPFYWQEDYGVFSVDGKRLSNVIAYVENQKQHHQNGTIIPILERVDGDKGYLLRENRPQYFIEETAWRLEMMDLS